MIGLLYSDIKMSLYIGLTSAAGLRILAAVVVLWSWPELRGNPVRFRAMPELPPQL
jgi:hypothetical protein